MKSEKSRKGREMLLQTLQHTLSQLLAQARTDVRTAPMAVTKDGRIVSIGAAHADRFIPGEVRHSDGYGNKAYGIVMNWLGRCAAVMTDTYGPTMATGGFNRFGPAGTSQPSRSAKT
jgi:hypothetical protein